MSLLPMDLHHIWSMSPLQLKVSLKRAPEGQCCNIAEELYGGGPRPDPETAEAPPEKPTPAPAADEPPPPAPADDPPPAESPTEEPEAPDACPEPNLPGQPD